MSQNENKHVKLTKTEIELYYLIIRYLSNGPFKAATETLISELESNELVFRRLDWKGEERSQNFQESISSIGQISPQHLFHLCSNLGPLVNTTLPQNLFVPHSLLNSGRYSLLRTKESIVKTKWQHAAYVASGPTTAPLPPPHNLTNKNWALPVIGREYNGSKYQPLFRSPDALYKRVVLLRRILGHLSSVYCVMFDRTGTRIFTGSDDSLIKCWSVKDGRLLSTFRGHQSEICDMDICHENVLLASASCNKVIRIWDARNASPITILQGHSAMITSIEFSAVMEGDTRYLVSTGRDGNVCFWTYSGRTMEFNRTPTKFEERSRPGVAMLCCSWSRGGRFVTVGGSDKLVHVYHIPQETKDMYMGPSIHGEFEEHTDNVDSLWFAHSGLRFVSGSRDCTAKIWKFSCNTWQALNLDVSRSTIGEKPSNKSEPADEQSMKPTTSESRGGVSTTIGKFKVTMVAWDCSDKNVFTALTDFTIKVWNSQHGTLQNILKGHTDEVYCLSGHPTDSSILLSAGHDGNVILWNVNTSTIIMKFHNMLEGQGHGAVFDARFSPDGSIIACTDSHGHLLLFGFANPDAYTTIPSEQFFHTDYRPLIRDANGYVLDEQTQQAPHLMPPPFLVDMEGNPHPPELQRLVPGRERCSTHQLVPDVAVGENGQQEVLGDAVNSAEEGSSSMRPRAPSTREERASREGNAAASILDNLISQMQMDNGTGSGPSVTHASLLSPSRSAPVGLRREGEVAGVRQMHENAPRSQVASAAELADLIKRIIIPQLTIAQLEQNRKYRRRQSLLELDWLKRERRRRLHSFHKKSKEIKIKTLNRRSGGSKTRTKYTEEPEEENARDIFRNHKKKARRCRIRLHQHGYSTRSSQPVGIENTGYVPSDILENMETASDDGYMEFDDDNEMSTDSDSSSQSSSDFDTDQPNRSPRTLRRRSRRTLRSSQRTNDSSGSSSIEDQSSQDFATEDLAKKRREKRNLQRLSSYTPLTPSKRPQRKASKRFYETLKSENEESDSTTVANGHATDHDDRKATIKPALDSNDEEEPKPTFSQRRIRKKKKKQTIVKKKLPFDLCEGDSLPFEFLPPDWITNLTPRSSPYVPQIGDEVVYMQQGHECYVNAVLRTDAWTIDVDEICYKKLKLSVTETCHVVDIQYETGPPTLCQLTLRPVNRKYSGKTKDAYDFTFKYHDMADIIDFIILKQKYLASISQQWSSGDRFRSMIDERWWYGVIVESTPFSQDHPDSPFQSLLVSWDNEDTEKMSPWDLEPIAEMENGNASSTSHSSEGHEGEKVTDSDRLAVLHYTPTESDWTTRNRERFIDDSESDEESMHERAIKRMNEQCSRLGNGIQELINEELYSPFSAPVSLQLYPGYAMAVAYPTDLTTLLHRLNNRFYRRLEAFAWEVRHLEINARLFNEPHSSIVRIGKQFREFASYLVKSSETLLVRLLLAFVKDDSCNDVLRLHRSLHIKRRVEQSSTSEDDSNHDAEWEDKEIKVKERRKLKESSVPKEPIDLDFWKTQCEELLLFIWSMNDAKPFRNKVDIGVYPDYLDYVSNPICLEEVRENFSNKMYATPEELFKDVSTMFSNSRCYNTDKKSQIYCMTIRLQALVESRFKPILDKYKENLKLQHSHKKNRRRYRRSSRRKRRRQSSVVQHIDVENNTDDDEPMKHEEPTSPPVQLTNGESKRITRSRLRLNSTNEKASSDNVQSDQSNEDELTTTTSRRTRRKTRVTRYHESDSNDDELKPPRKKLARIISIDDEESPVFRESSRSTRHSIKQNVSVSQTSQRSSRLRQRVAYHEYSDDESADSNEDDDSLDLGMSSRGRRRKMSIKAREGRVF